MNDTEANKLLLINEHRPYELPTGQWRWYLEWTKVLLFHFKVDSYLVQELLPKSIHLDLYECEAWISLVAFSMEKVRPRGLPAVSMVSDFHELNIRTYINDGPRKGIYFFSIDAEKFLSTWITKLISKLPYQKAIMKRTSGPVNSYSCYNPENKNSFSALYLPGATIETKNALDEWLTERYCIFMEHNNKLLRYDVHHSEWMLHQLKLEKVALDYKVGDIRLSAQNIALCHYSEIVQTLAWPKVTVILPR